ncbi:hypothetical protein [Pseudarthrobacter sp. NS4]|uniref:hypothetical protein n=1 Tax=Pseudarthrobacter sp. NS4 TaxID=2973976 RepID=UPI002163F410|nr:hypothetical protein [Pseudarthrobacter sp. NS4]
MKTLYGISLIILAIGTSGCGMDQLSPKGYPDELGVCPTIGWSNSAAVVLEGPAGRATARRTLRVRMAGKRSGRDVWVAAIAGPPRACAPGSRLTETTDGGLMGMPAAASPAVAGYNGMAIVSVVCAVLAVAGTICRILPRSIRDPHCGTVLRRLLHMSG